MGCLIRLRRSVKPKQKILLLSFLLLACSCSVFAADTQDSGKPSYLPDVNVVGTLRNRDAIHLPEIVGTQIYAGKKNSLILLKNINAVVVNNNMRQILAKVPGIHIWESDASGIQVGIAARGLSPNRSWEFNTRQNGYDIASDPFGYPEAYYNPPMQAVQKIQVVRGAGALQYGPQFGGMVNYILRDGSDIEKPFQVEAHQTLGSYGLLNTFNAIGGNTKRINYYIFYDYRQGNGWRQNNNYHTRTLFGTVTWKIKSHISLTADQTFYSMLSQQPGGLTDVQFQNNPRTSHRSRNWMQIPWSVSALKFNWEINEHTRLQAKAFYLGGDRKSVGYLKNATIGDTLITATQQYHNREVARDLYENIGLEFSFLHEYKILAKTHSLSAGLRTYNGQTSRMQKGIGTNGSGADFSISTPDFPVSLGFNTRNLAAYAENIFRIGKKLLFIPGVRFENIVSTSDGRIGFNSTGQEIATQPAKKTRQLPLMGVGLEYHALPNAEIYANFSQAYRPVLFSDLAQNNTTDVIDPNLQDASGYNADLGIRGSIGKYINLDLGPYLLQYNKRIAAISKKDSSGNIYSFRTNAGSTTTWGFEGTIDADIMEVLKVSKWKMPVFVTYSLNNALYNQFIYTTGTGASLTEKNLKGNRVENAPQHIIRGGIGLAYRKIQLNLQGSHVSAFFTDAQNTNSPAANGQTGRIASYSVFDLNCSFPIYKKISLRFSINNLTNTRYATRRSGGYPGPGLLPADGRTILGSLAATF